MNLCVDNRKTSTGSYQINSILRIDDKAYFVPINKQVLVEYSFVVECEAALYELPEFSYNGLNPFIDIVLCCGKIVLIPNHADIFIVFDLISKTFRTIDIPNDNINCYPWGYFSKAYVYKDKVYAIGRVYPGIVKVDVEECTCEVVLNMSTLEKPTCRFMFDSAFYEGAAFLLSAIDNYLLVFDLDTIELKKIQLGARNESLYKSIVINNETLWMINNSGEIACFDANLTKKNNDIKIQVGSFYRMEELCGDEPIHSIFCNDSIVIGTEKGSVKVIKLIENGCELIDVNEWQDRYFIYCFFDKGDKSVLFFDNDKLKNFRIDLTDKKITEIKIPSDDGKYLALGILEKKKILTETDVSLEGFVRYIINK